MTISYLNEHPEFIPQLAEWLFAQWGGMLSEKGIEPRVRKLQGHLSEDKLAIAWVAHENGEPLGTAALRAHDLEERNDLTPWLGGVLVASHFRRRGIGEALCTTVEEAARARGIEKLYLFT